jgi:hypothetical protein
MGRPKGARNKATEFIKPIAQRHGPECIQILMTIARNPKKKDIDRKGSAELVLAYGFGEPAKTLELGGIGGGPIRMSTVEEKQQALESILDQVLNGEQSESVN